jgi:hypothetical protein
MVQMCEVPMATRQFSELPDRTVWLPLEYSYQVEKCGKRSIVGFVCMINRIWSTVTICRSFHENNNLEFS